MGARRNNLQLFGDDEGTGGSGGFSVNKQYASRFEHNKKREELHRLKEKYPEQAARMERQMMREGMAAATGRQVEELTDESSDEEDEDLGAISDRKESQILAVLQKIKAKDPAVFDPNTKFFSDSDEEEEEEEEDGKGKKEKPMLLKDLVYKQAMEGVAEDSDDEGGVPTEAPTTYTEEQHSAKSAFLKAVEEVEGDDASSDQEFAARRAVVQEDGDDVAAPPSRRKAKGGVGESGAVKELLDGFFGADDAVEDEGDRFLKKFILSKGWVDRGQGASSSDEGEEGGQVGEGPDYDEDEVYLKQAEQYEHRYNFRFEEPGSSALITHPRKIEGTVRKEDDRRKRQRAEKAERLAAQERERAEEMRRLKNLKKEEVNARLKEIQDVAGGAVPPSALMAALADDEFDPEEYDRQMAAAYDENYYEAEEEDPEALEAEYEKQLEALAYGSDDDDDAVEAEGRSTFAALHKSMAGEAREAGEEEEEEEGGEADDQAMAAARAEVRRLLDEYYKLDYEGVAGGVRTRFRYKDVTSQAFGLSSSEVLAMEDKDLNQVVGLKLLAPYRDEHRKLRPNYAAVNALKERAAAAGVKGKRPHGVTKGQSAPAWKHGAVRAEVTGGRAPHPGTGPAVSKPQPSAAELRAASYAAPTLRRPREAEAGGKLQPAKKKAKKQEEPAPDPRFAGLTKAQKKNMKRGLKRASAKIIPAEGVPS